MKRCAGVALLLLILIAAPAEAGTYEVKTCSPTAPGGVNNAWTYAVAPISGSLTQEQAAGYVHDDSCTARDGLAIRANTAGGDHLAFWGVAATWEFTAPPDTQIVAAKLWRYARVAQTDTGNSEGRWETLAQVPFGAEIGGPLGQDQCKPGSLGYPNPCIRGERGLGPGALSSFEAVTKKLSFGLFCGTDKGTIQGCHTGPSGAPLGEFALRASVVTIRDEVAPAVTAGGSLLADGWQRGDASIDWAATDSAGIRTSRLAMDGQEMTRTDVPCDYTFPAPCPPSKSGTLGMGTTPIADGTHQLHLVVDDAAGNPSAMTRTVKVDSHGPTAVLSRASSRSITVTASDTASGVAGGTISIRNSRSEPFRALPTTFAKGRLTAKLDRGSASRVGISVSVSDNAGNVTAGQLSEMSLRVGGRRLRGGAASVGYSRRAAFSGRLETRDGVPLAGQAVAVEQTSRAAGSSSTVVATVTTDARGRFTYRAPTGPSRRLRFIYAGASGLAPLTRSAQLRVRATSTIHASRTRLRGGGRVKFSGRLGLRGAKVPRSGKLVDLQAYDAGRWRTFATARARGSKGAWSSSYRFGGSPGRYPVRLRIRREDVFPYDLGYSRSVVVRVR
jgi:hypothetical protein